MKFIDFDGKEHEFETPGDAVAWAMKELKSVNQKIENLYNQIKELKGYKDRICKDFGLKRYPDFKRGPRKKSQDEIQHEIQQQQESQLVQQQTQQENITKNE